MATDSDLLTSINAAIASVIADIAAGKRVVEYREGPIQVKRSSPEDLLAALRQLKTALSEDANTGRCASVGMFRGSV